MAQRSAVRGPGSNQHQDKPPLAPTDATADTAVADASLSDPLAQEQMDRLLSYAQAQAVPKVRAPKDWFVACTKCDGSGEYPGGMDPTCWACKGSGRTFTDEGKKRYAAAKKDARKDHTTSVRETLESDPELRDALDFVTSQEYGSIWHGAHDIAGKWARFGSLSPKQRDVLVNLHKKETAPPVERPEGPPAPEGKTRVDGTIVKIKESTNGYGRREVKMLVKSEEGWRAWMTAPKSLYDSGSYYGLFARDLEGVNVSVEATLEQSEDDPSFAFGKRPKSLMNTDDWPDWVPPVGALKWSQDGFTAEHLNAMTDAAKSADEGEFGLVSTDTMVVRLLQGEGPAGHAHPQVIRNVIAAGRKAGAPVKAFEDLTWPEDWSEADAAADKERVAANKAARRAKKDAAEWVSR